jgi:perosamine synthetase
MPLETKSLTVYKKALISNFSFLKAASNIQESILRAIPIPGYGFLVPVSKLHKFNNELVEKLTDWRNENVHVYPTQFIATVESTKTWLKDRLLAVDDRMLFSILINEDT